MFIVVQVLPLGDRTLKFAVCFVLLVLMLEKYRPQLKLKFYMFEKNK